MEENVNLKEAISIIVDNMSHPNMLSEQEMDAMYETSPLGLCYIKPKKK